MIFIKIIFKLLDDFGLLDSEDRAKLYHDAEEDWKKIRIDDAKDVPKDLKYKIKVWTEKWWVSVLICVLYFPVRRYLQDYIADDNESLDDHDDDDD